MTRPDRSMTATRSISGYTADDVETYDNLFADMEFSVNSNTAVDNSTNQFIDMSDSKLFKQQQLDDKILKPYWKLAQQQKGGFFSL